MSPNQGYYRKGWDKGWYKKASGGWTGNGCAGVVVSVPMSGSATTDDNDNVVVWWYRTGAVTGGRCAIAVYVPNTGVRTDAAGHPAHYVVHGDVSPTAPVVGEFDIDQASNQGRWVNGGTFPVSAGALSIRMVTRGIGWGTGHVGDHLGVSALRVSCLAGSA